MKTIHRGFVFLYSKMTLRGSRDYGVTSIPINVVVHEHHFYKEVPIPVVPFWLFYQQKTRHYAVVVTCEQLSISNVTRYNFYSRQYTLKESKLHNLNFCLPIIYALLHFLIFMISYLYNITSIIAIAIL